MNAFNRNILQKISPEIAKDLKAPFFGNTPPLDIHELTQALSESLSISELKISFLSMERKNIEGILDHPNVTAIKINPFSDPLFWTMSDEDKTKLTSNILASGPKTRSFQSETLSSGFYRYILLETLYALQQLQPIQQMTLQIVPNSLNSTEGLVQTIEISMPSGSCFGQLIIPDSLRHEWIQHYAAFPKQYFPKKIAENIPLDLRVKIGTISLTSQELNNLKLGDAIIPDMMLTSNKVILSINSTPLFQARISDSKIQLENFLLTQEDFMNNEPIKTLAEKLEVSDAENKALQDLTFNIHVELAKIPMSLDQVMNLSPGNVLEIPELSEKTVRLTINGKKIAIAELISIGENLGLKILEI